VRTSALHRVGDLLSIGQVLFPNDGGSTSSEAFFNDQATQPLPRHRPLPPRDTRPAADDRRDAAPVVRQGPDPEEHFGDEIRKRQKEGKPLSDECTDALQRLTANWENTLSSIVSTFNAPLTIFADAIVDAATSADDFSLHDVRRRRMSIYVRIPPNRLANARPLLNLFFSQLVSLNTRELPGRIPASSCSACSSTTSSRPWGGSA
jgi:type IV secretion system protein VirD4